MKWVAVFLIVLVAVIACGDVVDGEDTKGADLEARVEAIEEALSAETLPQPWRSGESRQGLIDVSDLEWRVDSLDERVFYLEMGWR